MPVNLKSGSVWQKYQITERPTFALLVLKEIVSPSVAHRSNSGSGRFSYQSALLWECFKTKRLNALLSPLLYSSLLCSTDGSFKQFLFFGPLTVVRICLRSGRRCSWSGCNPSVGRPPPSSAQCSPAPGTPPGQWSGSPLTCGRLASVWRRRCSSSSAASIYHPGGEERK